MKNNSIQIFYFSGTGNSLYVARRISELLDAKLISMASTLNQAEVVCDAATIGIVYPCYLAQISGVPNIVEDFMNRLKMQNSAYFFAICTYGCFGPVNSVPTSISLHKIADNNHLKLSAQFSIKLPLNNLDYDHVPVPINRDHEKMFGYTENKIEKMVRKIQMRIVKRKKIRLGLYSILTKPLFMILKKIVIQSLKKRVSTEEKNEDHFRNLIKKSDYSISVNDQCIGCGICEKICPVKNIRLVDEKPTWLHKCEMCLACDEWCPQQAIHHWCKEIGKNYHHPKITLNDMLSVPGITKV